MSSSLVATQPTLDAAAASGSLADAYAALKLTPGASRRDIRKAYLRIALLSHPDRNDAATNSEVFQQARAAYERLLEFTQYDEQLEELDAELEEQQRELDALERKRKDREAQQEIIDNILRHNRMQRDKDMRVQQQHDQEAARRLNVLGGSHFDHRIDSRAYVVRDQEAKKPPPKGIMLEWGTGDHGRILLEHQAAEDVHGNAVDAWASTDKQVWIEKRASRHRDAQPFWLLMIPGEWGYRQYALHTLIPYNTAEARHGGTVKWANWFELILHPDGKELRREPRRMISRAVDEDELRAIQGIAQREVARVKEAVMMAKFRAEEQKEEVQRRAKEAQRLKLEEQREEARQQKEAAQDRARRMAEEAEEAEKVRQLEYQDAEWKAFLQEVRAPRALSIQLS